MTENNNFFILMKSGGSVHGITQNPKIAEAWTSAGGIQVELPIDEISMEPYAEEFWNDKGEWIK